MQEIIEPAAIACCSVVSTAVVSILSAIVGGGLSACGAWLAIERQVHHQNVLRTRTAREFFEYVVKEAIIRTESMQQYRSANDGQVAGFDLQVLISIYQVFERNREHLIQLKEPLRDRLADLIYKTQLIANTIQNYENDRLNSISRLSVADVTDSDKAVLSDQRDRSHKAVSEAFAHLPSHISQLKQLQADLSERGPRDGR